MEESRDRSKLMLKGASPGPKPQTSLVASPLLMGRGDFGIGENVEENRSYLIALVFVEGGSPFENLDLTFCCW